MAVNVGDIIATTLRKRRGMLADNVSNNTALLFKVREAGNVDPAGGGRTLTEEVSYDDGGGIIRYSGYELLDISPSEVIDMAEYDWKQAAKPVTINGREMLINSGKQEVIDLLAGRISNAESQLVNGISDDIYSDGTADDGLQIGGMQSLISDAPTSGTVGGIDRATYTWWRNFSYSGTGDGGAAVSASNIQSYMNRVCVNTTRNKDGADLIVADNNYFTLFWESLQAIQRIQTTKLGEAGFNALKYKNIDVVCDGGYNGSCPADHMYFIDTTAIKWRPHRQRNFVAEDLDRIPTNQDAIVKFILLMANMTMKRGFTNGVLIA